MSGGEKKKKATTRGFGWEEAGGEFYQECYPGTELDLEALPRDPHYFATLLPSKQNRAATSKRQRHESKSTFKRRTSTRSRRYSTMGQNTVQTDIHVSMMPDLSENLANEESTWEEIMLIKAMPVGMSQKKEMKAKLLSAETFRLQGLKQFKWQRRKLWEYLKMRRKEVYKSLELWRRCIKTIEGNFGTGVAAYFLFIKWLMFLNLWTSALIVCFVVAPTALLDSVGVQSCENTTQEEEQCCQLRSNTSLSVIDLIQGSGWLQSTLMYYGVYPNGILDGHPDISYNLPLAYLATLIAYLIVSLCAVLKSACEGFRQKLVESQGQYYRYCNALFSGWDFCIYNDKSANIKQRALYYEMRSSMESERWEEEKKNRSKEEACRIVSVRVLVNIFVLLILGAAASLVYFTFVFCSSELETDSGDDVWYSLLLEFGPVMCVVLLNRLVPRVFSQVISFEKYTPSLSERMTLCRNTVTRFTFFLILLFSVHSRFVRGSYADRDGCPVCWETCLGRQIYKLLLMDIVVEAAFAFLLDFPRMLLAEHVRCSLARTLGSQTFDLSRHAIDLAYTQSLVWFGSFYAPFLPAFATFLMFFTFYIKKFSCLVNSSPSTKLYGASRSTSLIASLLLVSFFVAVVPWAYAFSEMEPSATCGPFRGLPSAWTLVEETYGSLPLWLRACFERLSTASCLLPLFLVLIICLYYYYIVYQANSQMVSVLKKQLVLEGHDKQFLLNRLSAFIKQHQERHKPSRSVDPTTELGNIYKIK